MFLKREPAKYERMLESELERSIRRMGMTTEIDSQEYIKLLTATERLQKMLNHNQPSPVSREVMLTVAGNLVGILFILKHEWAHPITSKALSFVIRPRT